MIKRNSTIIKDHKPGTPQGTFTDRQVFYVETDEAYRVDPLDRFIHLIDEVDLITEGLAEVEGFYCWILFPDGRMTGIWSEDGEFHTHEVSAIKPLDSAGELTESYTKTWAGMPPKSKRDKTVQTVSSASGSYTITLPPANSSNTVTKGYVDATYTGGYGGITVTTSPNVPEGTAYIINNSALSSVAMTSNGQKWTISG